MAVEKMDSKWVCIKFISKILPGIDEVLRHGAIHRRGVEPVKVHCMRLSPFVCKVNPYPVPFSCPYGRSRDLPIIGPCPKKNSWRNFYFFVLCRNPVLP